MRDNIEGINLFVAILIILLALGVITAITIDYDQTKQDYNANASVISIEESHNITAGIDAGQNLHFGRVTQGTNVTKTLNLESPRKSHVRADSYGNMSQSLDYQDNHIFEGNHSIDVTMRAEDPGYYEGGLVLDIKVANNEVTRYWFLLKKHFYS